MSVAGISQSPPFQTPPGFDPLFDALRPQARAEAIIDAIDAAPAAERAALARDLAASLDDAALGELADTIEGRAALRALSQELANAPGGIVDAPVQQQRIDAALQAAPAPGRGDVPFALDRNAAEEMNLFGIRQMAAELDAMSADPDASTANRSVELRAIEARELTRTQAPAQAVAELRGQAPAEIDVALLNNAQSDSGVPMYLDPNAPAYSGPYATSGLPGESPVNPYALSDALYVPGPIPAARFDVGPLSLTVNGALNALNSVANSGLNLLGLVTEPIDRYQGELITLESNLGPGGRVLAEATAFVGATSRAVRGAEALNAAAKGRIYTYNAIENPGPLASMTGTPAANFCAGRYDATTLIDDLVLYRAGESGKPLGQWFTYNAPESVAKVRLDSAVKSQWVDPKTGVLTGASPIDMAYAVRIPKGTVIYEGPVGYQGGSYLGGPNTIQVFVPQPWKLPGVRVTDQWPLR